MLPQYWPPSFSQTTGVQAGGERTQIPELSHCQPTGQLPHSSVPQQPSPIRPQYRVPCLSHAQSDMQMPIASASPSRVPSWAASGGMALSPPSGAGITSLRSAIASLTPPGPASSPLTDRVRSGERQVAQLVVTAASTPNMRHLCRRAASLGLAVVFMPVHPS